MPDAMKHLTPQDLAAFGQGELSQADADAVAQHLKACPSCRAAAQKSADSFLGQVRDARPAPSGTCLPPGPQHPAGLSPAGNNSHPSAKALALFGNGKLSDAQAATVAAHLETCAACRQAVAASPPDSFVGKVRDAKPGSSSLPPSRMGGASVPEHTPSAGPVPDVPPELAHHPKFHILRELGRGGMGVIYLAEHRILDKPVALKVISPAVLANPQALARFQAEVKAAGKLDHPNIARAYDADQAGPLHFLVLEFVEGLTLAQFVEKKGPLPVAQACRFIQQAALGLQHAFEKDMTHRDIKPQNLMLTPKGVVKVLDFGLARVRSEQSPGKGLTQADAFMGTPEYVAPEQATDARSADTRADVYSLGCTLYFLLTGRPPFQEDTMVKLVLAHLEKEPRPLQEVRPDVPEGLSAVVNRMLAKDPAQRYQRPIEAAQALVPFIKAGRKPGVSGSASVLPAVASAGVGTWSGSDTDRAKGPAAGAPRPPVTAVMSADQEETAFGSPGEGRAPIPAPKERGRQTAKAPPRSPAWRKRPAIVVGSGVAVLGLLTLVGLWASGVFRVKTADGTLLIEVNEPNPEVFVDGEQVTVAWGDGGKKAEIRVKPGTRKVELKMDGVTLFGEEVEIEHGKRRVLTARLVRHEPPPGDENGKRPPAEGSGFVSLFNGKDLAGWKSLASSKARWEVKDGLLSGSGGRGYLFNDGPSYENFHLRVEATINDGGNSGVYFRSPFGPTTPQGHPAFGYEAQINITHKDPHKTGSLYLAHKLVAGVPNTLTELDRWFTLEVRADGPHVVVRVNGKVTANFIDLAVGTRSGRLALQVLDAATVVQFRKIEIKELPPGDLRIQYPHGQGVFEQVKGNVWLERRGNWLGYFREHTRNNDDDGGGTVRMHRKIENDKTGVIHLTRGNGAWWNVQGTTRWTQVFRGGWSVLPHLAPPEKSPAARVGEWVPLWNGRDLSGWEAAGNKSTTWTCEDQALVGRASAGPAGLLLSDRADYENFHLRLETQLGEGGPGSLFVRCGPPSDGTTGNKCYAIRIGASNGSPTHTGSLVLSAHLDEVAPLVLADAAKTTLEPGKWFALEVLAEGKRLRVLVEGKTVVDCTDHNETFTVGRLGLVCRGKTVVRFRKMEVKELPASKSPISR